MSNQSLSEQVKNDIQSLQSSLRDMQISVRMTDIRDRVEDLGTSVNGMDRRIKSLRERGYAFEKDLEETAADFQKEWARIGPKIEAQISKEVIGLERSLRPLETQITGLAGESGAPAALRPRVSRLKSQVETLEGRIEAVEGSIRGTYDQFSSDFQKIKYHLTKLEWMLTELSEASFELLATESGIMAVKAVWAKNGKQTRDDPEGVLYLTDQRILFEQKEKVTTKKILFVATEKKLVQELLWQAPVALIEQTKTRKEGFLNKDDYIELHFGSGAPDDILHLHIWQRGDEWKALLKRAKAKEFDGGRAIPIDEAAAEKVKGAPTKCPSCGGAINQVVLRGMESMTCEYCGDVIRL
jgi:predicted  nucleic acid-binding Zn-ribbon protein